MKQPEESTAENVIRIGKTDFHYGSNELRYGKERVTITSRQAELLRLLAETPNIVVSRERILQEVWGDDSYSNSLAGKIDTVFTGEAGVKVNVVPLVDCPSLDVTRTSGNVDEFTYNKHQ